LIRKCEPPRRQDRQEKTKKKLATDGARMNTASHFSWLCIFLGALGVLAVQLLAFILTKSYSNFD
jgi:hypothetical protein